MNFLRLLFTCLLGLLSSAIFAFAEEAKDSEAISTETAVKQYIVSFHDEATATEFSEISKWITDNKGEIVESINENFAKLIIAKSDPSILELSNLKPNIIESVEEDDLDWDDHNAEL